jgi:hypothetical protein
VLGLDISTNTGWCILTEGACPVFYGTITKRINWRTAPFPYGLMAVADDVAEQIVALVSSHPEITEIVIEEVNNPGRFASRFSQKSLSYIHYAVLKGLKQVAPNIPIFYVNTSDWRRALKLSVADTKKVQKKYLADLKKLQTAFQNAQTKEDKTKAKEALDLFKAGMRKLCIHGKVDKKSISVGYVNTTYNMDLPKCGNDISDAICEAVAFMKGAPTISNKDVFDSGDEDDGE